MAKKFFFVCAGLLMLVGAYSIGVNSVEAQDTSLVAGIATAGTSLYAINTHGDVFKSGIAAVDWVYTANIYSGIVVNSEAPSLGDLKSQYK